MTLAPSAADPDRIITANERRRLVPYSHMQIWRMERDGRFPKRIKLGPHRVGWSYSEIMDWIAERKSDRNSTEEISHDTE